MSQPDKTGAAKPPPSPRTDPTNPINNDDLEGLTPREDSVERAQDEPGLTDRDREERDPG